ncbi:hypothetical protein [Stenotrophomonas oahuensis]|uniref:Uncharacterized protein n=1 Tax=Stenotrophomonas oahuensis TaxID=3003271 RepID=A0ABY9YNZ8_9GAMM|nr:hypothetical protein [Stenotrophomonas sp. A5586]WNH52443.1 hypothetical protein PDM29_19325 [Stenotrophomonas sp. A5586]
MRIIVGICAALLWATMYVAATVLPLALAVYVVVLVLRWMGVITA